MSNPAPESEDSTSHLEDGSSNPPLIAAPNPIEVVDDHIISLVSQFTTSDAHQHIISPVPTKHDSPASCCTAENEDFLFHLIWTLPV